MVTARLAKYLQRCGCAGVESKHPMSAAGRTPTQICDSALQFVGFTEHELGQIHQRISVREQRVRKIAIITGAMGAVLFFYNARHVMEKLNTLSALVENWDVIKSGFAFVHDVGLHHVVELTLHAGHASFELGALLITDPEAVQRLADLLGTGLDIAEVKAHLGEAVLSGGLSLVATGLAWGAVKLLNAKVRQELTAAEERSMPVQKLHSMLTMGALPGDLQKQIAQVPAIVVA